MDRSQLLGRISKAWQAFQASYAGLPAEALVEPGVTESWSVRDLIAHVTIWEEESLKHLPLVIAGGTPPRYAAQGGIDAFNARTMAERARLSLPEVVSQSEQTHARLMAFLETVDEAHLTRETRFRRRLRWDTYGHYALHVAAINAWRASR